MPLTPAQLAELSSILPGEEVLDSTDRRYAAHAAPWSLAYDLAPAHVLVPSTPERLALALRWLYGSELDFAVRGRGTGSASAHDVVLSMRAFDGIVFDEEKKVVELGAGLEWGEVDEKLATLAPGYIVVGARCPNVGVIGCTLSGGLSWTSNELGLGSDPANMLDAQIALYDGRLIWASEEPDLLWALRGGGGNFGVVTKLRLRAHEYASSIFAGMVFYPTSALETLSKRAADFTRRVSDGKMAMHIFILDYDEKALYGSKDPSLFALLYDANGWEHGWSEQGFKWALDIEGVNTSALREMALADVHGLQKSMEASHATSRCWLQAALLPEIDDDILLRGWDWYQEIAQTDPELSMGSFFLLEIMQEPAMMRAGDPKATAWPHAGKGRQNVLQLSVGAPGREGSELADMRQRALDILKEAPTKISGKKHPPGNFLPNFLLDNHDLPAVFGDNWEKLRQVKAQYDPKDRFGFFKGLSIPPAEK